MRKIFLVLAFVTAACTSADRPDVVLHRGAARHIIVFGDSLALGSGASDPADSFTFRLFRRISAPDDDSDISSHAVGGARVADVIEGEFPLARHEPATDVWIIVGSNDVTHGTSPGAFGREELKLVHAVRRRWITARIVVFGIPDLARSPLFTGEVRSDYHRRAAKMNAAARDSARSVGGSFVDLYAFSDRVLDIGQDLASDEFHPNDRGQAGIAEFAYRTVR